ncbi:MAG: ATP-grasp domain-containing protein [Gammaproteobacteria bacterium]
MNKHILLVNASDEKNLPKVLEIKKQGLTLTLAGGTFPEWIRPYVDLYIECNLKDIEGTLATLKKINEKNPFHGAITFWDREVEITAAITDYFKLPGPSINAIKNAKNKFLMRSMLAKNNIQQAKFFSVATLVDLEKAAENLGYPFIFKPVAASASAGVFKIENHQQLTECFQSIKSFIKPDFWLYPDLFIAEEYMSGNEVSVEGVVNQGKVHFAGITQKWKTLDNFVEWQHCFPAQLSTQKENQILEYTKQCLAAVELDNTAFHVELIDHNDEIKMVEINARMGGDFITSDLLPLCNTNIAKAAIQTSLGLECHIDPPQNHACVRFLLTNEEGKLTTFNNTTSNDGSVKKFGQLKQVNDDILLPPSKFADNRLCYVITQDEVFENCINSAANYLDKIEFSIE